VSLISEIDDALISGGSAWFSDDRAYRYLLTRTWGTAPLMTWIMLNPSTADAAADDPTIRRCRNFARREGCGGIQVVNLFALRSTDPLLLRGHSDPVGPSNDEAIGAFATGLVVAAWGAGGSLNGRSRAVGALLAAAGVRLLCLGVTARGEPRHPLYARSDAPLIPWELPS
jgi:hypothetical protein